MTLTAEAGGIAITSDPGAFDAWAAPHTDSMRRLAARLAPTADAEDVFQRALIRAWQKWRSYDARRGTAAAWLLAITADQARRAMRGAGRNRESSVEVIEAAAHTADSAQRMDIERALVKLSKRQRLAVELYYFGGLTTDEVAQAMGVHPGTTKSTLSDARSRLRDLLGDTDG